MNVFTLCFSMGVYLRAEDQMFVECCQNCSLARDSPFPTSSWSLFTSDTSSGVTPNNSHLVQTVTPSHSWAHVIQLHYIVVLPQVTNISRRHSAPFVPAVFGFPSQNHGIAKNGLRHRWTTQGGIREEFESTSGVQLWDRQPAPVGLISLSRLKEQYLSKSRLNLAHNSVVQRGPPAQGPLAVIDLDPHGVFVFAPLLFHCTSQCKRCLWFPPSCRLFLCSHRFHKMFWDCGTLRVPVFGSDIV